MPERRSSLVTLETQYGNIDIDILEIDLSLYRDSVGTTTTAKLHRSFVDWQQVTTAK